MVDGLLMQNEDKTDNKEIMITFSSDFSAPSESFEYAKVNNEKFWNYKSCPISLCVSLVGATSVLYQTITVHDRVL